MRPSARSADWKTHYSSMDKSDEEERVYVDQSPISKNHSSQEEGEEEIEIELIQEPEEPDAPDAEKVLSNSELKLLLSVRQFIYARMEQATLERRASDIRMVDGHALINPNTLESFIHTALLESNIPLHIGQIITRVEEMGWVSQSQYHKYKHVDSVLNRNYFMFQNLGNGHFQLREGFRGIAIDKTNPPERIVRDKTAPIPTIEDIVATVATIYSEEDGIYPGNVYQILRALGSDISYSMVHKAMQTDRFVKEGFAYKVR